MADPSERHSLVGPGKLWEMKRAFQIHFLQSVGQTSDQYLLDLGCGTLRGGIPIIKYLEPGHYYGIETREHVLREGKQELIDSGLQDRVPHLLHIDNLRGNLGTRFDMIWAFFVKSHLSSSGSFYANVNIGERRLNGAWQGFPRVSRPANFYKQACLKAGLSLRIIGPLRNFGHISGAAFQDAQQMLQIRHTEELGSN
jgi:SAM-dependent methyltransferase